MYYVCMYVCMSLNNVGLNKPGGIKRTRRELKTGHRVMLKILVRMPEGMRSHGRTNGRWYDSVKIGVKNNDGRTSTWLMWLM
jgi:hypothetical protein